MLFRSPPTITSRPVPYTLYHATLVHTPKLGEIEVLVDYLVGVNEKGIIDFLRPYKDGSASPTEFFKSEASKDNISVDYNHFRFVDLLRLPCLFLVPGFIDTHIHASQYPNVGIGSELPLLDWLKDYTFALENKFTSNSKDKLAFAKEVYQKVISKTLANGTTCASYFTTIDAETTNLFADLLVKNGQRGFVGKVCMDCNPAFPVYEELYDECIKSMDSVIRHCNGLNSKCTGENDTMMVKPIVTPRFAPVCTSKLLKKLGAMAKKHHLPVQTHISENKDEVELVNDMFPDSDNYASVYNDHDLLGPSTILAHAIHLDKEECQIIREKNCSISHCPLSNTFITSGEAPVKKYLYEEKLNVSLGTDISGGYEQSILGVARSSIMVSHHLAMDTKDYDPRVTVADALYMATAGGARACRLEEEVGTFAVGKKFDVQLIDLDSHGSNVDMFEFQKPSKSVHGDQDPEHERKVLQMIHRWVFSGDDRNCVKVWCNGRVVVDKVDHKWVYVDSME
ncbi:CIC11C00000004378 [Sungouiella intermedia]|uniref:Probable guanine deaminase n=1 Tax=Sungouiella intermedia TaxID=45354 RepID=A0A1L0BVK5_9ASCO|nr:CIC11C00000004378 [[Candida] intermedia]